MLTKAHTSFIVFGSLLLANTVTAAEIAGDVTRVVGNCMWRSARCITSPVETEVLIVKGKVKAPLNATSIAVETVLSSANFLASVKTDRDGYYSVDVEAGVYTLFAVFGETAYLNLFTGDGYFWPVEVGPSDSVEFDIANTEDAYF